ncbi:DUF4292 domain-containing protein [Hymenobacter sp. 15J16-1T3B]|uniref:DUF4292 domain-containing protein n=1 Tax=Hymenobacter sp. 15J16-1T3B TaxID=2886941 RepID=UPI001D118357|nr:DUF4292 domain-containing protein [Hymenobacter sp. 15J16-1T3B]MCC3159955.1 DUF4292 domain-containing protein [Hymenobacter sp. 15J16-1T3B]
MNRRWPLLVLIGSLSLGACTRRAVPTKTTTKPTRPPAPEVRARNLDFRYLAAKGKAQIDANGEKYSANLAVRMRKDSVIWVSASLLGIEGIRARITPDSVQVINKLEKTYYAGNFDYLRRQFNVPITFVQLQSMLIGDYVPAMADSALSVMADGPIQRVQYQQTGILVEQLIELSRARLQKLNVSDPKSQSTLTVTYADFQPIQPGEQQFAHGILVQAQQPGRQPATVTINYRNVDLDKEQLSFPFSVPAEYGRKNRK